ncbi:MAG: hypothetical protein FJZ01_24505, partial [Candidatus Sericytochromatia bacterium]|nr:hypothetical protein [Candidatus Tanganyikabacteria bacterium]
ATPAPTASPATPAPPPAPAVRSAAPLAGTRFYGISDSGQAAAFRISALQSAANVTVRLLSGSGSVLGTTTHSLPAAGSSWDFSLPPGVGMYRIDASGPVVASWDNIEAQNAGDDDIAAQTGFDYVFRIPRAFGTYWTISHADSNLVLDANLTTGNPPVAAVLAEGDVLSGSAGAAGVSDYHRMTGTTGPTTTIYGNADKSFGTQVYAPGMQTYYAAFRGDGMYLVGWEDGTTVNLTNFDGGTTAYALNRGTVVSLTTLSALNVAPASVNRFRAAGNRPFGFYVHADATGQTGATQHSSSDRPTLGGSRYHVVSNDPNSQARVYVLSLDAGNSVALSGGIEAGPMAMGADEWALVGNLGAGQVLNVTATGRVLVWTAMGNSNEQNYTLLPAE